MDKVICDVCGYRTSDPCNTTVQQAIDCPVRQTLQRQLKNNNDDNPDRKGPR